MAEEIAALEERMAPCRPKFPKGTPSCGNTTRCTRSWRRAGTTRARRRYTASSRAWFLDDGFRKASRAFSAGWQMRIALARAILEAPHPAAGRADETNLDIEARTWLEEFLAGFPGGVLLVSHDRYFLDVVVLRRGGDLHGGVSPVHRQHTPNEEVAPGARAHHDDGSAQQGGIDDTSSPQCAACALHASQSPPGAVQSCGEDQSGSKFADRETLLVVVPPAAPSGGCLAGRELFQSYRGKPCSRRGGGGGVPGRQACRLSGQRRRKSTLLRIISEREPDGGSLNGAPGVVPAFYSRGF